MNKFYDKILLLCAVLVLLGGVAIYMTAGAGSAKASTALSGRDYEPIPSPVRTRTDVNWSEPQEQPSGFIYDVFTPYEIYLTPDGEFTQVNPNVQYVEPEAWEIELAAIERPLYRVQLEGYIEEVPGDMSKALILFLDAETGSAVRGRIGQTKDTAQFEVLDFKIDRTMEGGAIIKTAIAVIKDLRDGMEYTLTDAEPLYGDSIKVVLTSNKEFGLEFELTTAGESFSTASGNYILETINLEDSTVSVKKLGDELNEPIVKLLQLKAPSAPTTNDNTTDSLPTSGTTDALDAFFE